jgi:hypothetical protein
MKDITVSAYPVADTDGSEGPRAESLNSDPVPEDF